MSTQDSTTDENQRLAVILEEAVQAARGISEGEPAAYIPELRNADLEQTSAAITLVNGRTLTAGDAPSHLFTLQSSAKVVLLAGLLEDLGEDEVFRTVGSEPSGTSFASIARLETHGPKPANPLVNAGAIALCGRIPGNLETKLAWLDRWVENLYGERLSIDARVLESERRTADRNRAIAYFLKGSGRLEEDVEKVLQVYFTLCSYAARVDQVARMASILAAGGIDPAGNALLSPRSASCVVSLMATCGMYDESGEHLLRTGLPAKSGVSGVIVAVAASRAGIAVSSPRINAQGGSPRGHAILDHLSRHLGWHFALPAQIPFPAGS